MIEKLHKDGFNSQQIANELGLEKKYVDLYLIEYLYKTKPNSKRKDINLIKSVINDRHYGITLSDSCKKYGLNNTSISRLFKDAGIYFPNPKYFDTSQINTNFINNLIRDFNNGTPVYKLVETYGYNKSVLAKLINENGGNTTAPSFNIHIFDNIDTEEKAYWLGFLMADGNVSQKGHIISLELKIIDAEHLFKFKTFLNSTNNIKLDFGKLKRCRFNFANKYTFEALSKWGCVPNKSLILQFPYLIPKTLYIPFIRGYFDGDGSLTYSYTNKGKTKITVSTNFIGTKSFLQSLQDILLEYNIKFNEWHNKHHNEVIMNIDNNKSNSVKLLNLLYSNATIYLERKYQRYLFFKQDSNFAVYKSDFIDNDRAISAKAKFWINNYFKIDFDKEYANAEITKEIKESLVS